MGSTAVMLLEEMYFVSGISARNSAIVDKPRDAFVQYAMAWLTASLKPRRSHTLVTMPTS